MNQVIVHQLAKYKKDLASNVGIEKEALRIQKDQTLSNEPHPKIWTRKHPYITTDFAESQLELITPIFQDSKHVYNFLANLYTIVEQELKEEYIWPQSMPCILNGKERITSKITCKQDPEYEYRLNLLKKYGMKQQLISGIHYNFSFQESLIQKLWSEDKQGYLYQEFKNQLYLKVTKNYIKYRWLITYLLGCSNVVHESFEKQCIDKLTKIACDAYSNEGAISYRNSVCGYRNKKELYPDYTSLTSYINSMHTFIKNKDIENMKEFYSSIRIKGKNKEEVLTSLHTQGIQYLEFRNIDINPFDPCGINLNDLQFLHVFQYYLLCKEEEFFDDWQQEAYDNQEIIANYGLNDVILKKDKKNIRKEDWALEILNDMCVLVNALELYDCSLIQQYIEKVKDVRKTYAYRMKKEVQKQGFAVFHFHLSKQYKLYAEQKQLYVIGYEDMELSTQHLMKESIKQGLSIEILDKKENFISISNGKKIEYVKQATKTSLDSYSTVLLMENKMITKELLKKHQIKVPKGKVYTSMEEVFVDISFMIHRPCVIKPKSTNFGKGISIFSKGTTKEELLNAFQLAFTYDDSVLYEKYIQGKEHRFLIINDEVVGVLHRVPANVVGDGIHTIAQLIELKNASYLRGKGYKTPLEKIEVDEAMILYLKHQNITLQDIPKASQVVYVRDNSNISTGGDSIDDTDDIPDKFKQIALKASKVVKASICGVDMMIHDVKDENSDYAVIELNFNPAIHIHAFPYQGKQRNIAIKILKALTLISK